MSAADNAIIQTTPLYGHQQQFNILLNRFNSSRQTFHHAHIVCGNFGIGKTTFVNKLIAEILAKENPSEGQNWIRMFYSNSHPDIFRLQPSEESKTNTIDVDEVRALSDFLSTTASCLSFKAVIIDALDNMGNSAINATLKLLEEPRNNVYFFVICHNRNNILKTILSRCLQVTLNPLSCGDFCSAIKAANPNIGHNRANDLFLLSAGNVSLVHQTLVHDIEKIYLKLLEDLLQEGNYFLEYFTNESLRPNLPNLLQNFWLRIYRQLFAMASGIIFASIDGEKELLTKYLAKYSPNIGILTTKSTATINILRQWHSYHLDDRHVLCALLTISRDYKKILTKNNDVA